MSYLLLNAKNRTLNINKKIMTTKEKNRIYWEIVSCTLEWYEKFADKNYFKLDWSKTNDLACIACACNIKPRKGWSRARTLWKRVYEGRPF